MEKTQIKFNKIQCNICMDIIESTYRHDFKYCTCGKVSVDGGKSYLKRSYTHPDDYIELSEYSTIKDSNG